MGTKQTLTQNSPFIGEYSIKYEDYQPHKQFIEHNSSRTYDDETILVDPATTINYRQVITCIMHNQIVGYVVTDDGTRTP